MHTTRHAASTPQTRAASAASTPALPPHLCACLPTHAAHCAPDRPVAASSPAPPPHRPHCDVQAQPRGLLLTTTVLVQFHHTFITKVDRAYRVQCFYAQVDWTLALQLNVRCIRTATA